ncbi:putative F-box protein [Raphanus sativus]|uniref:F-box protein At5g39480 n=1 Tax=Raphanus sativus TaxID=3726 RepID=A0A6J0M1X3_RAPSA|nr:putative F-box protein At5g39480 [Raphanus sativus]KAJ4902399.1 putative F-box protein [Raphanus sativus]
MTIRELRSEESFGGNCLLLSLPEDVFAATSRFLSPSDICNLRLCCKSLCERVDYSEKIWFVQCELVEVLPLSEIARWRIGISSYKALCRFLVEVVKPLVGVWVHQEPELGNVVYVMPGFLSVVGCRIIPQKVGPLGIQEGRVMWSPVFEIICDHDGSTKFFLHGRGGEGSCVYPGLVSGIDKTCNVLSLEVEPRQGKSEVPFQNLDESDRRNLVDVVTGHVGLHVFEPSLSVKLFPTRREDEGMLLERRTMLLKMQKFGENWKHMNLEEDGLCCYNPTQEDINEMWEKNYDPSVEYLATAKEREIGYSNRLSFLSAGDTFGLSLKASYTEMSSYEGWPNINGNNFSLYKLPVNNPMNNQEEHAGLWGGTFGWPPGRCNEDETGSAFYLLMLSYEESENNNGKLLIGTKILEGTDYVDHPNGTAMFVVDIDDTPSLEPFPFDADGRDFEHSYAGRGISGGYGFRHPGSIPGSLYVISHDHLAFVWHETTDVFTFKRVNLEEILKKGLGTCVPPLPPVKNFTYLEIFYTNVFIELS